MRRRTTSAQVFRYGVTGSYLLRINTLDVGKPSCVFRGCGRDLRNAAASYHLQDANDTEFGSYKRMLQKQSTTYSANNG